MTNTAAARRSDGVFFALTARIFTVSAASTVAATLSMPDMQGMTMPWMLMPGESWFAAGSAFLGMWTLMMVAMMLPSLTPKLQSLRRALWQQGRRADGLTALVGFSYFLVWTALGLLVFPLGVLVDSLFMHQPGLARLAPVAQGLIVLAAGLLQFSSWKARQLACCREQSPCHCRASEVAAAFRYGARLGLRCCACCAGPTAILLVVGVMDLAAMTVVTLAITAERLAPHGSKIARALGAFASGAGVLLIARAAIS